MRFEENWPEMRPVVLKLLQQEPVSQKEWQNLFYTCHLVCLWDDTAALKMKQALKNDIMDFINNAQQVRLIFCSMLDRNTTYLIVNFILCLLYKLNTV